MDNLEEQLAELAREAENSDKEARQELINRIEAIRAQVDDLKKRKLKKPSQPTVFLSEDGIPTEIYRMVGTAGISVSAEYQKAGLTEIPSGDYNFSYNRVFMGEVYPQYDPEENKHIMDLISLLREKAEQEAIDREHDAVLIEEEKIRISGSIFNFKEPLAGPFRADIKYNASVTAYFYDLKDSENDR
ncbi:MAG: hypothetical protein ABIH72_02600 [archaeon]